MTNPIITDPLDHEEHAILEAGDTSEAAVIGQLARQSVTPVTLTRSGVYALPVDDENGRHYDIKDLSEFEPKNPLRKVANRVVRNAESFVKYLEKHAIAGQTEIFADSAAARVVALIDSHEGHEGVAGWEAHTVTLQLETTPQWLRWLEYDGKLLEQMMFADFVEINSEDVVDPDPATFLEIAQSLAGSTGVEWQAGAQTSNGQVQLGYKETVTAKAGQTGQLEIPKRFGLSLRPYLDGPRFEVEALFRYRLRGGSMTLGYALLQTERVLETAFNTVIDDIKNDLPDGVPLLFGKIVPSAPARR